MQPFQGSYTHAVGDRFIFRGGVRWPNTALPLWITLGGNSNNWDYYGVDASWHVGSVWTRPLFDAEGIAFTNHGGLFGNVIQVKPRTGSILANYVIVDSLEIKGHVWNDPAPTSIMDGFGLVFHNAYNGLATNLFIHDWVVRTAKDSKFGGIGTANKKGNISAINCIVQAPAEVDGLFKNAGNTSGCGTYGVNNVEGCEIIGTTQGIWAGYNVLGNIVRHGGDSFRSDAHENGMWIQNDAHVEGNLLLGWRQGVGCYFLPGWGPRGTNRIDVVNNVFESNPQINLSGQSNPDISNEIYFVNNVVANGAVVSLGTTKGGAPFKTFVFQNNILVGTTVATLSRVQLGSNYTNDLNIHWTAAEAEGQGLSTNHWYRACEPISDLAGGLPFPSITIVDAMRVLRHPLEWTKGAHELSPAAFSRRPFLRRTFIEEETLAGEDLPYPEPEPEP